MEAWEFSVTNYEVSQLARIAETSLDSGEVFDFTSTETLQVNKIAEKFAQVISAILKKHIIYETWTWNTTNVARLSPGWMIKFDQTGHDDKLLRGAREPRENQLKKIVLQHKNREKLLQEVIWEEYIMPEYWFYHDVHKKKIPYRVTRDVSVR